MPGSELMKIKEKYIKERKEEAESGVVNILIHMGTCGIAAGGRTIFNALLEEVDKLGVKNVKLRTTGCAGLCSQEPMITVEVPGQPPVVYAKLDAKKAKEIFYSHVLGGHVKPEYAIRSGYEKPQTR